MTRLTYKEQLNHPKWQRRRLERLEAAGWKCEECSAADLQLHVHHEKYFKNLMAWEYDDHQLKVLCHKCHSGHHVKDQGRDWGAVFNGTSRLEARAAWLEEHGGPADQLELQMARTKLALLKVEDELKVLFDAGTPSIEEMGRSRELMNARMQLRRNLLPGYSA